MANGKGGWEMRNAKARAGRKLAAVALFMIIALVAAACGSDDDGGGSGGGGQANAPAKIKVQLSWIPDAQFAGYIIARDKGF
jgi:NitT/TauT family transport system substrate-binding protein